jgi:uncharacterized membrane protein
MTQVLVIVLALLIGVIAGLRAMTAPAVVAWGAMLGWIDVATRLIMGAFAGAVIGSAFFHTFSALGAGIVGAVLGTLGGAAVRTKLYEANNGKDRPGAFIEDVVAVGGGFLVAFLVSLVLTAADD